MQRSGGIVRASLSLIRARGTKIANAVHNGRPVSSNVRMFHHVCNLSLRNESSFHHPWPRLFVNQVSPIRLYSNAEFPNHFMVSLPALSPTMDVGTIVRWEKQVGDKLNEGDLLCEIETDKATMGFETPEEGYLAKVFIAEGTRDIPIMRALCIITENEGDVAAFKDFPDPGMIGDSATPPAESAAPPPLVDAPPPPPVPSPPPKPPVVSPSTDIAPPVATVTPTPVAQKGERVFASPLAKKLAAEKGIDLQAVTGSGPRGRIRKQDIESFVPSAAPIVQPGGGPVAVTGPYIDLPIDQYRQELAQRAVYSKQTVPHYFLTVDIEADNLIELAEDLNQEVEDGEDAAIDLHHFVVKAAALACHKVPAVNSSWMGDVIRQYVHVDVNFTMQSVDRGQVGPVIYSADTKGLGTISKEIFLLNTKLLDGQLQPEDYQGGTFTVTDLSEYGIKHCGSVITPPQACSLAMGSLRETFVPDDDAEEGYRAANVFSATLACDHRVVDGAVGAQWLQHFKGFLQKPHTMLL